MDEGGSSTVNMKPLDLEKLERYVDIGYFKNSTKRDAIKRNIQARINAWGLNEEYYDGNRNNGYGGFVDDGRWRELLSVLLNKCEQSSKINNKDYSLLDLGCKKGFIVDAAKSINISAIGVESHNYPLDKANSSIKHKLIKSSYTALPFADKSFNFCIAFSSIYMLNLGDVIKCLMEIKRISDESYITVGAYNEKWEKEVFQDWTLLGTTILHTSEWIELFDAIGYRSYYCFTTPSILGFKR
jgi:hypothetical protein